MIPEVQAIVNQIAAERERFERFCRSLSEEELWRPVPESTWVVKDFISHLATIDLPVAAWFSTIQGRPVARTEAGEAWDVDRFNDEQVAKRRERAVEEILAEAATARTAMIAMLDRFTEEQVAGTTRFGGDSKRPASEVQVLRYLQGWARHDVIHVADMLKALPERREDPPIVTWFAEPGVRTVVGFYQKAMA